ncbi:hypothetical protein HK405_001448, partial [Cladochytrium tenue]
GLQELEQVQRGNTTGRRLAGVLAAARFRQRPTAVLGSGLPAAAGVWEEEHGLADVSAALMFLVGRGWSSQAVRKARRALKGRFLSTEVGPLVEQACTSRGGGTWALALQVLSSSIRAADDAPVAQPAVRAAERLAAAAPDAQWRRYCLLQALLRGGHFEHCGAIAAQLEEA